MTGRAMRSYLESLGICAQKIVRRQDSGHYVADFFVPEMNEPIAPSTVWAESIRRLLNDVEILGMSDTVASWRPGHPVICATVVFALSDDEAA